MRGKIILWSGAKGVVSADGQRYDFDIHHWKGDTTPTANLTVDLAVTDGRLVGVTPVNHADLTKEKLAAIPAQGNKLARAIYADVGKDVAITYGIFVLAALFLSAASLYGLDRTLADLLGRHLDFTAMPDDTSGEGTLLVLIAVASIAVPHFWKHRYAPLAFCVPLFFTAYGFWPVYRQYSQTRKQIEAMSEFGRIFDQMAQEMSTGISLGIGAWILIAAGGYLAFKGVKRFLGRS